MTFEQAFYIFRCHLVDKYKTNPVRHQYIMEELSYQTDDGSWRLVGQLDTVVAQVSPSAHVKLVAFS